MNKNKRKNSRVAHPTNRRITVRSVRREPEDYRKLARVLIALAQAEAEAQAAHEQTTKTQPPTEAA